MKKWYQTPNDRLGKTVSHNPETQYIDVSRARRVIRFVNSLPHTSGKFARKPFNLRRWQRRYLIKLLATCDKDTGVRAYNESLFFIARKNGKTELIAALALYFLFCEPEESGQIVVCAGDKKQASILFDAAKYMCMNHPVLEEKADIKSSVKRIIYHKTNSVMYVHSADADLAQGFNCSMAIIDELHVQRNDKLYQALTKSMGTREEPLMMSITTAGYNKESVCYERYSYSKKIIEGTLENPNFLPMLFEADDEDDWKLPETWKKANPALGDFKLLRYMEGEMKKADDVVAYQSEFKRWELNQWQDSAMTWISSEKWEAARVDPADYPDLKTAPCFMGLDLSAVSDLTALARAYVVNGNQIILDCNFYCPQDRIVQRSHTEGVPYASWAEMGAMTAIPGSVIDHRVIQNHILELSQSYNIKEIGFDRYLANQLVLELSNEGFDMVQIGQGYSSMSSPTKEFERLLIKGDIKHLGNPVLSWNISNVVLTLDPAGNVKPDKSKASDKIDGAVACIMAVSRAITYLSEGPSRYETGGLRFI